MVYNDKICRFTRGVWPLHSSFSPSLWRELQMLPSIPWSRSSRLLCNFIKVVMIVIKVITISTMRANLRMVTNTVMLSTPRSSLKIDSFPQNLSSEYERTIFTKIHLDFGNSCQYLTQLSNWEQFRVWKPTLNCKLYLMRFGRINC